MTKEIELRVVVDDEARFDDWLQKNAKYKTKLTQKDFYLEPRSNPFLYKDPDGNLQGDQWLRIRVNNDQSTILCLKNVHRDNNHNYLYSDEYESNISDYKSVLSIFKSLGYRDVITVIKTRCEWNYGDITIAKDSIDGLGTFFEIEICNDMISYKDAIHKITNLLEKIICISYKKTIGGYPQLIWNKKNKKLNS